LQKIAGEKAGIIKSNVPVVISERQGEVEKVFLEKASRERSPITFASDHFRVTHSGPGKFNVDLGSKTETYQLQLRGDYQRMNLGGVLVAIEELNRKGFAISQQHIADGLANTISLTRLNGRWQRLNDKPLVICDTGHNEAGIREVLSQIHKQKFEKLHMVWGMVGDKDPGRVLSLLPKNAHYYFCQAKIPRAMGAAELHEKARAYQLEGEIVADVNRAIAAAKRNCSIDDMIFIGGSTFVVGEIEGLGVRS
jgi:dihydrofolate synthase/folylpolyglutamate synthase